MIEIRDLIVRDIFGDDKPVNWDFGIMSLVPEGERDEFLKCLKEKEDDGEV